MRRKGQDWSWGQGWETEEGDTVAAFPTPRKHLYPGTAPHLPWPSKSPPPCPPLALVAPSFAPFDLFSLTDARAGWCSGPDPKQPHLMQAQPWPSLLLPFLRSHLSLLWDNLWFPSFLSPSHGGVGGKYCLSREGQQIVAGVLEGGKQEGPSREKSLKLLEGQGRGDKEKGEGSGHCCPLMPLPTVQAPGMGIGMLGARSNREERGAGETHC